MATLKDVARLAMVDASTASRVLRNDPVQWVSVTTRERIVAAAQTLRYRPNALARGLRTRRTDTIGFAIPSLDNIGFSDVTHGIQSAALRAGKLVMVVEIAAIPGARLERTEQLSRLVDDARLDGLIVAFATIDDALVAQMAERKLPLVLVNRRVTGVHGSVVVDDEAGSRLAVRHLIEIGHRRIAFIGLDGRTDTARRRDIGYRSEMTAAGLVVDPSWIVPAPATEVGGREAVATLLHQITGPRPTALFAASLQGAVGVLAGLRESGLRVPDDISVISFNDHPIAAHLSTPLTAVRMPNFEMGEAAVQMLLDAMENSAVSDLMVDHPPELVVRASTSPPSDRGPGD